MKFMLALLFFADAVHAEYRAFELLVRNTETGTERRVVSTLDHLEYRGYYPVGRTEVVEYSSSWRCRGRTGNFRKICANPANPGSEPKPNSAPPGSPN